MSEVDTIILTLEELVDEIQCIKEEIIRKEIERKKNICDEIINSVKEWIRYSKKMWKKS